MTLAPIDLALFDPSFGAGDYMWGPRVLNGGFYWKDHRYHAEFLSWHYHDYLGTHAFAQIWDYSQQDHPEQTWQMVLLRHSPIRIRDEDGAIVASEWAWQLVKHYERPWGEGGPRHTEVGADIDAWLSNTLEREDEY